MLDRCQVWLPDVFFSINNKDEEYGSTMSLLDQT